MADGGPPLLTLQRFFLPPGSVSGGQVRFSEEQSHQIRRVLRLRAGDRVIALDGSGDELEVALDMLDRQVTGAIVERCRNEADPPVAVDLYIGVLKGSKLETVLQKGTEIGVAGFIPLLTERAVPGAPSAAKQRRYETIVREAAEQSRRGRLPAVAEPLPFDEAVERAARQGLLIVLWEEETADHLMAVDLPDNLQRVGLVVGPEGGLTPEEVDLARSAGGKIVTLGNRILRAETAGIVAPALLLARLGALG